MKPKLTHIRNSLPEKARLDTITEVSRGADMNLWFVEAHEQSEN